MTENRLSSICKFCFGYMIDHPEEKFRLKYLKCPCCGHTTDKDFKMAGISKNEILMNRIKESDLDEDLQKNLNILHEKINAVRKKYNNPMIVSSGYRTQEQNEKISGAGKASWHLKCAAIDIKDVDGKLWKWCMENLEFLKEQGLYLEDKRYTKTWVHFQIYPPKSGRRIFIPSNTPPPESPFYDGNYDTKFD